MAAPDGWADSFALDEDGDAPAGPPDAFEVHISTPADVRTPLVEAEARSPYVDADRADAPPAPELVVTSPARVEGRDRSDSAVDVPIGKSPYLNAASPYSLGRRSIDDLRRRRTGTSPRSSLDGNPADLRVEVGPPAASPMLAAVEIKATSLGESPIRVMGEDLYSTELAIPPGDDYGGEGDEESKDNIMDKRNFAQLTTSHMLRRNNFWLFLSILTVLGAFSGLFDDLAIKYLLRYRKQVMGYSAESELSVGVQYLIWISWVLSFTVVAMVLVWLSPMNGAEGAGVAHVKAAIQHWHFLKDIFSLKVYFYKILGLCFSIGAGLWLGKADVHICVIIAVQLLQNFPSLFANIALDDEKKYWVFMCAAGLGVSVNFGAPIAGVLFGIEICGNYYHTEVYMKCIFVCVMGAYLVRWGTAVAAGDDMVTKWINVTVPNDAWTYGEIPLFLILGVVCGLFGALFVFVNERMLVFKKAVLTKRVSFLNGLELKYLWAFGMAFLVATVTFPHTFGAFLSLGTVATVEDMGMSTVDLESYGHASDWLEPSFIYNLSLTLVLRYVLTTLLVSCAIPGGPYTPFLVIGSLMGRLYIELIVKWFPIFGEGINTEVYGLVGSAAITAAATHQRFSSAVLVLELTGVQMMFPLLLCVTVAAFLSSSLHLSLTDSIIKLRGWNSFNNLKSHRNDLVKDIMIRDPSNFVTEQCSRHDIELVLEVYHSCSEFAVLNNKDDRILLGIATRSYLEALVADQTTDEDGVPSMQLSDGIKNVPITIEEDATLTKLHACVILTRYTNVYVVHRARLVGFVSVGLLRQFCDS